MWLRIRFVFKNNDQVVFFTEEKFRFAWENSRKMKSVVLVHVKAICTSVRKVALFKERNENGCKDAVTGRLSICGKFYPSSSKMVISFIWKLMLFHSLQDRYLISQWRWPRVGKSTVLSGELNFIKSKITFHFYQFLNFIRELHDCFCKKR